MSGGRRDRGSARTRLSLDEYAAELATRWNTILDVLDRIEPQALAHWRDLASCKDTYDPVFFPEAARKGDTAIAKRWCADCPVKFECRGYAVTNDVREGIWGGMSYKQRQRWRP